MLRHCFSQRTILKIDAVRAIDENELLDLNMVFSVGEAGWFEFEKSRTFSMWCYFGLTTLSSPKCIF